MSVRGKTGFNIPREVLGTGSDWQASFGTASGEEMDAPH